MNAEQPPSQSSRRRFLQSAAAGSVLGFPAIVSAKKASQPKLVMQDLFETTADAAKPSTETEKQTFVKDRRSARDEKRFEKRLLEVAGAVEHSLNMVDHLVHPGLHGGAATRADGRASTVDRQSSK